VLQHNRDGRSPLGTKIAAIVSDMMTAINRHVTKIKRENSNSEIAKKNSTIYVSEITDNSSH